jgi:hypothetical protein
MGANCCGCSGGGGRVDINDADKPISLHSVEHRLEATDAPTELPTDRNEEEEKSDSSSESEGEWNVGDEIHFGAFVINCHHAEAVYNMRAELTRQIAAPLPVYPEVSSDLAIYKFLLANDMDMQTAVKAYLAMLEFRKDYDVDTVSTELDLHWTPEFNNLDFSKIEGGSLLEAWTTNQECVPKSDELQDNEGRRIRVIRPGIWKLKPIMKAVDQETLRRIHIYEHEHFSRTSMIQTKALGKLVQRCVLQDLSNFDFGPFKDWNMSSFRYIIFSELDPKHYPEEIGRFQVVHAPWAVGMLVKFIKALNIVPARTWEKVHIFTRGDNEKAQNAMQSFTGAEFFYTHFGGSKENSACLFMDKESTIFPS